MHLEDVVLLLTAEPKKANYNRREVQRREQLKNSNCEQLELDVRRSSLFLLVFLLLLHISTNLVSEIWVATGRFPLLLFRASNFNLLNESGVALLCANITAAAGLKQ